jgi:hypothetical protein
MPIPFFINVEGEEGSEQYCVYPQDADGQPTSAESLGCFDNAGDAALLILSLMSEGEETEEPEAEPEAVPQAASGKPKPKKKDDEGEAWDAPMDSEPDDHPNKKPKAEAEDASDAPSDVSTDPIKAAGINTEADGETSDKASKRPLARIVDFIKSLTSRASKKEQIGTDAPLAANSFKALGNGWWIGVFSNNFKDREGEILTAAAHERYILRANLGYVPMPELWFHHIPGSRHGKAVFIDEADHLIYAVGKFDDTEMGKAFEEFYLTTDWRPGMSHGFRFEPWAKTKDGLILDYNTFEISVLDLDKAANPFTSFVTLEDMKMALSTSQREALLDKRLPANIRTLVETAHDQFAKAGKALEQELGADAYKEYIDLTAQTDGDSTAEKGQDATLDAKFFEAQGQLIADLLAGQTKTINLIIAQGKMLKAQKAELDELREELDLEVTPASESDETELDEEDDEDWDDELEPDEDEAKSVAGKARERIGAKKKSEDDDNWLPGLTRRNRSNGKNGTR